MTTILSEGQVPDKVKEALAFRDAESRRLDRIYQYLLDPDPATSARRGGRDNGPLRWLKPGVPREVRRLAEMSRVNMLKFVVNSTTQVMYVDGFRSKTSSNQPSWETWQINRMDARQIAVHRAALSFGASYATVLPGDPKAVIRGSSPRTMTAVYGDDEDWPEYALELRRSPKKDAQLYRLYDATSTFWVEMTSDSDKPQVIKTETHGVGHVPVIRFLSAIDEDGNIQGDVEPLIPIQDQINVTTFGLLVAQHYSAFRQRYIIGWTADSEAEALSASAKSLWTFDATARDEAPMQVGEFNQTDLKGYIDSREASLRHLATISQTPAHELLGQLVNLSAEALAQVEASFRRKVLERQIIFGESWEQTLELAARIDGETSDPMAEVRWRDTEARSLAQAADALGKLVQSLGVPPQALWEKIPNVTQTEVDSWKEQASQGDAMAQLAATLDRQSQPGS